MPMQPSPMAETIGPPRPSLRCFISSLTDPNARRHFFPAMPDCLELRVAQRASFQQFRILLPTVRMFCADDGGVHAGNAERKAQSDSDFFFAIVVAKKIVIQLPQSLPVFVVIGIDRDRKSTRLNSSH